MSANPAERLSADNRRLNFYKYRPNDLLKKIKFWKLVKNHLCVILFKIAEIFFRILQWLSDIEFGSWIILRNFYSAFFNIGYMI